MRYLPVGVKTGIPDDTVPPAGKPRVQAPNGVLHVQARVQDQVLGACVRRMYGGVRLPPPRRPHEPAVSLRARGPLARNSHARRY